MNSRSMKWAGPVARISVLLPITIPPMLRSLIYHSGLEQWVHLWSEYQGTQSHATARIKIKLKGPGGS
jgi:hypothetical protein